MCAFATIIICIDIKSQRYALNTHTHTRILATAHNLASFARKPNTTCESSAFAATDTLLMCSRICITPLHHHNDLNDLNDHTGQPIFTLETSLYALQQKQQQLYPPTFYFTLFCVCSLF